MAQSTGKQPFNIIFPPQNSASNSLFSPKTSGDYGEAGTLEFLKDFHRRRFQVLAEAGPDLIAFETIPNKLEAQVCCFAMWIFYFVFYTASV
jgi:S-methylmethionine-dependent homocysteine/selenocysteine methylase